MARQELIEKIKNGECVGADLIGADLRSADLRGAILSCANLRGADLRNADLKDADLMGANLSDADLSGADLDFSTWPLWCGSKHVKVDEKFAMQYLGHFCAMVCDDKEVMRLQSVVLEFAKRGHRAKDLGLI